MNLSTAAQIIGIIHALLTSPTAKGDLAKAIADIKQVIADITGAVTPVVPAASEIPPAH